jgi:uncharacterized protein YndB with AHSA1/START domain
VIADARTARIVPASRSAVWDVLTTNEGAATFMAAEVDIHLLVGGHYRIGFDGDLDDGGEILNFSHEQELVLDFTTPKHLGVGNTRVRIALEPLEGDETRVVAVVEFPDEAARDRLAQHMMGAWDGVLERLYWRMQTGQSAADGDTSFWKGA